MKGYFRKYLKVKREELGTDCNHSSTNINEQFLEDYTLVYDLSNIYQTFVNIVTQIGRCNALQVRCKANFDNVISS